MKSYQLKIVLLGTSPLIWRRVIMPADVTFNRLEEQIVVTNDDEAYEQNKFYKKQYKKSQPSDKEDPFGFITRELSTTYRKPEGIKIDTFIENDHELFYEYDFGDDWRFHIILEKVVEDHYYGYPILVDGAETAPPEDVGGIPGFYDFLEMYNNPSHPEHEDMRAWAESQLFREYDPDHINKMLKFIHYKKTEWDKITENDSL
ncbi:plasmid pRiA4b ORF-3 family protein [Thalassobacillus sp. CUG 92003]|uniref:plasmid pRiA4b ORF-3 family protein n=1 Tax=Thalassobacillus sp. CUG 92003 TaxID=2736641 RepID=UPI0015E72F2D|nr:plasmid pRiA4b ORF-3 family protein [Thalassobacillus sp. CUG 92003]